MKKTIRSFKDNIRKMFIVYSLVPAFVVACLGLCIFIFAWRYTIVHYNQEDNRYICSQMTILLNAYKEEINQLEQELNLQNAVTSDMLSGIYRDNYRTVKETGAKGNIYVVNADGTVYLSSNSEIPEYLTAQEYSNWGIMRKIKENGEALSYDLFQGEESQLCMGKAIVKEGDLQGYIVVVIPGSECDKMLTNMSRQFAITNQSGWIFLNKYVSLLDDLGRIDAPMLQHNGFIKSEKHQYYVFSNTIVPDELYTYTITDTEPRSNMIILIVVVVLLVFLAIGIITYVSTEKMANKHTQDIDKIAYAFEQVKKGNFDTYLSIGSSVEFETIGNAYNVMLDSLKNQIEENKELAEHMAFAQVKQLESQFNPHFLYNTLDNIRFMTKIDADLANKMVISLSKLLRYSISDAREEITVEEDIEHLQNYLTILKMRFNKRFTYDILLDEDVKKCLIPKLMVQPLIENAIKYGFAGREQLHVEINGYIKHDKLIFICKDDGAGIDEKTLTSLQEQLKQQENESSHLGLYNIHRRIQLLYKEDYGMRIESVEKEGTTVILILPIRQ